MKEEASRTGKKDETTKKGSKTKGEKGKAEKTIKEYAYTFLPSKLFSSVTVSTTARLSVPEGKVKGNSAEEEAFAEPAEEEDDDDDADKIHTNIAFQLLNSVM